MAWGLLPAAAVYLAIRFAGVERFWIAVAVYHAICVAVPALYRTSREGLAVGGGRRWALASLTVAVALTVAIPLAGAWVYARGWLPSPTRPLLLKIEPWIPFVVYSLAVNPFMEEWLWRGFLLPRSGIVAGSMLFGLLHFAGFVAVLPPLQAAVLCLPALAAGITWGWMRRASASLWPFIVTHLGADAGILWLFQVMRTTPSP